MTVPLLVLVATLLWIYVIGFRTRRRIAGARLVTCPETGRPAAVTFDVVHATLTALVDGEAKLRLADCSRWPVRKPCDQACVPQAQTSDRTVSNIMTQWSAGKRCVFCASPLGEAPFVGHHIAVRSPDGMTTEWPNVAPEELPEGFRTYTPVCWNCHVAETFRRQHPELVTDRCFAAVEARDAAASPFKP